MKIALIGMMPAKRYSGGRIHAWVLAEALANEGNTVYMITNNIPMFIKDYVFYPCHKKIQIVLTDDFYNINISDEQLDYVICFPSIGMKKEYYQTFIDFAVMKSARFSFINYETPNWYEKYTDMNRPLDDYHILQDLCQYGCLILSSAYESQKYAKDYYNKYPASTEFCVWSPPINTVVADSVAEQARLKQIIIFTRIKDKHKGGEDIPRVFGEYLRGWSIVLVAGTEAAEESMATYTQEAQKYGISLRFQSRMSEAEKFAEIKRSRILLFPSYFEGYGLPPVEALYCGTHCIAYDLPVLREISGNHLTYCIVGDISGIRTELKRLMTNEQFDPVCVETADFYSQAQKLNSIMLDNMSNKKLQANGLKTICRKIGAYTRECTYNARNNFRRFIKWANGGLPDVIAYCIENDVNISRKLKMEDETLDKVLKEIDGKSVYIWGTGRAHRELSPIYKDIIKVDGIIDGSEEKQGTYDRVFRDYMIQIPEVLLEKDVNNVSVLITTKEYVDEIIDQLENLGVKNYHSLCMIEMNSERAKKYKMKIKGE